MNTIYRSAENVAIWLGPAADESDLMFEWMKEWNSWFEALTERHEGNAHLALASISSTATYVGRAGPLRVPGLMEKVNKIWNRPWWIRAWIVQEATVAHESRTILFWGHSLIDWQCLRLVLQSTYQMPNYINDVYAIGHGHHLAVWLDRLRFSRETGANIELLTILDFIRVYECEDPRDKVYAALGMAMDANEGDIIPDYTKYFSHVYTDIVKFFITKSKSRALDILCHVDRQKSGIIVEHKPKHLLPS